VQVTVDLDQLQALCVQLQQETAELGGIANDARARVGAGTLETALPYGLNAAQLELDTGMIVPALYRDAEAAEQMTLSVERFYAQMQKVMVDPSRSPLLATQPDLWFFKGVPPVASFAAPAGPLPPVPAETATAGTAMAPAGSGDTRASVIAAAQAWIGTPYGWGGGHGALLAPRSAPVDCSGLVHQSFGANGVAISGTAASIFPMGTPVANQSDVLPGDLFFEGVAHVHHIAICTGDGRMIEAPHTGAFVRSSPLRFGDFAGFRRVLS
jgi:cell wall-associated NlpC family hydrolase